MTLLRRLATATAVATLALVAAGGIVRATGSGLGCPDWPRCHGRLFPPLEFHSIVEYSHRMLAFIVVVLVIATAWVAWRRARHEPRILWPAVAAVGIVLLQAALGAVVVGQELDPVPDTTHFGAAMLLVAVVVVTATNAVVGRAARDAPPAFRRFLWWTVGVTGAALLAGVYVRGAGASLAFPDWPLMHGEIVPGLETRNEAAAFAHRIIAAGAVVMIAMLAVRARSLRDRALRLLAWGAAGMVVAQAVLGAATVLTRLSTPAVAGHVIGSSLTWALLVTLAAATRRAPEPEGERRGVRATVGAYAQLVKPDIIVLLLITTVPAMILAGSGLPPLGLTAATLFGGTLAAAGANTLNCYFDRDIDEVMDRTRGRPIPAHRVHPEQALRFGVVLSSLSFVWLWATVNPLAAALALSAVLFYVFVYTLWMKRSTPQNIVIGGAAGAVPVLVGWAAVTGTVGAPAWILFAIVFFWTPPHFWALAMRYTGDYEAARVPMLPVLRGNRETARHILLYSLQLFAVSLLLYPVARMGAIYLAAAVALGAAFVGHAIRVARDGGGRAAMSLFRFSITYLGLLFAAVAVDSLARIPA